MKSKLTQIAEQLELHRKHSDFGCPPGWMSIRHLQGHFKFVCVYSASTKAKQLYDRGLLERKNYKVKAEDGKVSWAYAYKPKKPCRSLDEVMIAARHIGQEQVPKGWVNASEFSELANISRSAVFQMAYRHKLETRLYRIRNGLNGGIKAVCHFNLATLKKLHHLRQE
jgi:hypothetical protein